jgi:hypothetical protein
MAKNGLVPFFNATDGPTDQEINARAENNKDRPKYQPKIYISNIKVYFSYNRCYAGKKHLLTFFIMHVINRLTVKQGDRATEPNDIFSPLQRTGIVASM